MAKRGSQKFIAETVHPGFRIEYDVEVYGAEKMINCRSSAGCDGRICPVTLSSHCRGCRSQNAGNRWWTTSMNASKAMKPRAAFRVPNTLSGEGNISVDLTLKAWMTSPRRGGPQG